VSFHGCRHPRVLPVLDASEPRAADSVAASGRTPRRPVNRKHSARRQPSIPTVENPRVPGRRSIGRSRCNRGVATAHARHDRTPLERLVATTSPRGPRSTGIGRRSEVPRASRRRPPNRGPKASTGRSKGGPAKEDHRVRTRHPSAATEAATSRRHTRRRRSFDARAPPQQEVSASEPEGPATSTTRIGCSGCTPNAPARPSGASQHEPSETTDPRPRGAQTRCRHRIHATWFDEPAAVPRVTTDDATRPTQLHTEGVPRDAARSSCDRSHSRHTSHRGTCASATARKRDAPSE